MSRVELDPERGLLGLRNKFPGVNIDIAGAGDHLPDVDAIIRRAKEMSRSINASIFFKIPKNKANAPVTYVVNRKNTRRIRALNDNVCPRVRFTGRKVDYKLEYGIGFGDYCEVYNPWVVSNSMEQRTQSCIALYPTGNITGSLIFWNLESGSLVRRSRWIKLLMTRKIINIVNNYAGSKIVTVEDGSDDGEAAQEGGDDVDTTVAEPITSTIIPEEQGAPVKPGKDPAIEEKEDEVDEVDVGTPRQEPTEDEEPETQNEVVDEVQASVQQETTPKDNTTEDILGRGRRSMKPSTWYGSKYGFAI